MIEKLTGRARYEDPILDTDGGTISIYNEETCSSVLKDQKKTTLKSTVRKGLLTISTNASSGPPTSLTTDSATI
jgi:hypothetical protein